MKLDEPEIDWTEYADIVLKNGKVFFGAKSWTAIAKVCSGEKKLTKEELEKDNEYFGYGCRVCNKEIEAYWDELVNEDLSIEEGEELSRKPTKRIQYLVEKEDFENLQTDPIVKDKKIWNCMICSTPRYFLIMEERDMTKEKFFNKLAECVGGIVWLGKGQSAPSDLQIAGNK